MKETPKKSNFVIFHRGQAQKLKLWKKSFYSFFNNSFEAGIMSLGPNMAHTILFQYLKKYSTIQLYVGTYWQKTYFKLPISQFKLLVSQNLLLTAE